MLLLPIGHEENSVRRLPVVTFGIMAVCLLAFILSGQGSFESGEGETAKVTQVKEGSVVFVKAGVKHRFLDIEEDLHTLVFFSTAKVKEPGGK